MTKHYHHDGMPNALECQGCKEELQLGYQDGVNGAPAEKHPTHAYWAGYKSGLVARRNAAA